MMLSCSEWDRQVARREQGPANANTNTTNNVRLIFYFCVMGRKPKGSLVLILRFVYFNSIRVVSFMFSISCAWVLWKAKSLFNLFNLRLQILPPAFSDLLSPSSPSYGAAESLAQNSKSGHKDGQWNRLFVILTGILERSVTREHF